MGPWFSWWWYNVILKGCCWTKRHWDSWPPVEKKSIQGQRRGLITQSFCVITFYSSIKEIEKASDIGIRRGQKEYPLLVFSCYTVTAVKSLQLCPTLCDPMDCSLQGSSIHGIFQARILEGVAISSLVIKERNVLKLRMAPGPSSIRCILGSSWHQMIHPRPWNDWLESCRRADYPTKSFIYTD